MESKSPATAINGMMTETPAVSITETTIEKRNRTDRKRLSCFVSRELSLRITVISGSESAVYICGIQYPFDVVPDGIVGIVHHKIPEFVVSHRQHHRVVTA